MDFATIFMLGALAGVIVGLAFGLSLRKDRAIAMGSENELLGEVKRRRMEVKISQEISAQLEREVSTPVHQ